MKIFLIAILITGLISCGKQTADNSPVDCGGPPKSYSSDLRSILQMRCNDDSGCHGSGSKNGPGELLTFQQVFSARSAIRSAIVSGRMPLNGELTATLKNAILCWIDSGAPDN